jgi:hypothetical protein
VWNTTFRVILSASLYHFSDSSIIDSPSMRSRRAIALISFATSNMLILLNNSTDLGPHDGEVGHFTFDLLGERERDLMPARGPNAAIEQGASGIERRAEGAREPLHGVSGESGADVGRLDHVTRRHGVIFLARSVHSFASACPD